MADWNLNPYFRKMKIIVACLCNIFNLIIFKHVKYSFRFQIRLITKITVKILSIHPKKLYICPYVHWTIANIIYDLQFRYVIIILCLSKWLIFFFNFKYFKSTVTFFQLIGKKLQAQACIIVSCHLDCTIMLKKLLSLFTSI